MSVSLPSMHTYDQGSLSAHQRNAIQRAFRWPPDSDPLLYAYWIANLCFYFSELSSMKTVLCGIIILCLLTIFHDANMRTEAVKISWNITKKLMVLRCCAIFCEKDDICTPNPAKLRGCKCFTRNKIFRGGGKWKTYP